MQEWSIQTGQDLLKGYWYPFSQNPRMYPFSDDRSFTLVLALNGEVYADGVKIPEGFGRLLQTSPGEIVRFLIFQPGTECVRLQVPGIPAFYGHTTNSPDLFFLSSTCLYNLARLLIYATQVPRGDFFLHSDALLLIRCCLGPQTLSRGGSIRFDEMFRLVNYLHSMNGKVNAKLTVAQLAASCQLKTYRLQQICQEGFGLTAHQVLRFMKMYTALKAIPDPSKTLAAIGTGLKYSNDENLINAFRSFYGITPHALRKALPHLHYVTPDKL